MKRYLVAFVFASAVSGTAFAQMPVAVITDSPQTELMRANQQFQWVKQAENTVQQIQTAVRQLQDADQALQYQLQAMQDLRAGSWDGLVAAYAAESAAINQFSQTMDDFQAYDLPNIKAMLADPNYQTFNSRLKMLDHSMAASNQIVQNTNTLVRDTQQNLRTSADLTSQSSRTKSWTAQLQLQNQHMALLGQELADMQQILSATANYISVQAQNEQILIMQERIAAESLLQSGGGAGLLDQSNPDAHWKAMTDTSSWGN